MLTYEKAGVSVDKGNQFVQSIKRMTKSMRLVEGGSSIGGFATIASFPKGYKNPQMVLATDGVGTKILLCKEIDQYHTVGIDLVAMSVNDILTLGAEPYLFLDYYATSKLNLNIAKEVMKGIVKGCRDANCALVGGETAEMPSVYRPGDFDLAGFCVGVIEKGKALHGKSMKAGDKVIGLSSNGLHSNGFSLARKILEVNDIRYSDKTPFGKGASWGETLIAPTKIYVKDVLPLVKQFDIRAMAHITGGGLKENLARVLPKNLQAVLDSNAWKVPELFTTLASLGQVPQEDLYKTFNMGIGFTMIVSEADAPKILKKLKNAKVIGEIRKGASKVIFETEVA